MVCKTLVAYYSKSGASETYAKIIAETLTTYNIETNLINLKDKIPDVASYDNIILGTGVRMFMVYGRWKKVLKQKPLKERNLFMFLSSGTAIKEPDKAVEKFLKPIVDKYHLKPLSIISFPGMIPEKWAEEGADKETVKPEKAKAWAQEISVKLTKEN